MMCFAVCYSLENIQPLNRRRLNAVVGEKQRQRKKKPKTTHSLLSSMKHQQHLCGRDAFGGTENKSSWARRCSIIALPLAGIVNKQPSSLSVYLTCSINLPSSLFFHEMFTTTTPHPPTSLPLAPHLSIISLHLMESLVMSVRKMEKPSHCR